MQTPDEGEMKNAPGERFEWAGTDGTPPQGQLEALGRTLCGCEKGGAASPGGTPRRANELWGEPPMRSELFYAEIALQQPRRHLAGNLLRSNLGYLPRSDLGDAPHTDPGYATLTAECSAH